MNLLDTNVISEVRKGSRCDARVAAWYAQVDASDLFLSVLTTGEIRQGVERARPRDPVKAHALEQWLDDLQRRFADRILAVDARVADEWGRLSAPRTVPVIDGFLAATAKVHGLTLVTRNTGNVYDLGANLLNPFD
ncbi:MAG: type II toxin-antitoxin system VapC family toxin [Chloroflexi bacterium]|nr:type II toxin-antitoxin system VapC family toxin [Chloroflexota bacterium]